MLRESLKNLKIRIRAEYDKIVKVKYPVLGEEIYFNAQGFYHLNYEVTGRARTIAEQTYKLKLVPFIEGIIKNATVVDEIRLEKAPIGRKKKNGKKVIKEVKYISIVGKVNTAPKKIKVILRRVGNGRTIFWSVMKLKK